MTVTVVWIRAYTHLRKKIIPSVEPFRTTHIRTGKYVNIEEKKFIPTEIGIEITDKLQEFFKDIINVEYTKNMEDDLDKIAEAVWKEVTSLWVLQSMNA